MGGHLIRALPLLLLGCGPIPPGHELPGPLQLEPPEILEVSLQCDPDDERWTLEVEASAWTGGGRLYLSADGQYVESHPVRSLAAAADGSADVLWLVLRVVADWRAVSPGSSTAFRCQQQTAARLVILDTALQPADCALLGLEPFDWDDLDDLTDCPS